VPERLPVNLNCEKAKSQTREQATIAEFWIAKEVAFFE
jgi:hypothetical protein